MRVRSLFATRLSESQLNDDALLSNLADSIRELAAADAAGQLWSRQCGYKGYSSCGTIQDVHKRNPLFQQVTEWVEHEAERFADECALERLAPLRLSRMWVNLLESGGHQRAHIHARSIISGTLFVEAPNGSGSTCFEDPRLAMMMAAPPRRNGAPEDLHSVVAIEPRRGLLLLWESWLRHEVLTGCATGDRLNITFDFN